MLYDSHEQLLKYSSPLVNLQDIMGCENLIMVLIGEIALLQGWKTAQQTKGSLSTWNLVDKATWILEALKSEINRLEHAVDVYNRDGLIDLADSCITTTVFACAAVVYLQTSISANTYARP